MQQTYRVIYRFMTISADQNTISLITAGRDSRQNPYGASIDQIPGFSRMIQTFQFIHGIPDDALRMMQIIVSGYLRNVIPGNVFKHPLSFSLMSRHMKGDPFFVIQLKELLINRYSHIFPFSDAFTASIFDNYIFA